MIVSALGLAPAVEVDGPPRHFFGASHDGLPDQL